ncbi:hypothetical protein AB1Y20_005392 [Prymnesium parvum]|uniref:JmjC domain-containing protein n=1 Tax=Prymnesium parvum TaxID=97485 RepID=A0AB34J643_PRYPA
MKACEDSGPFPCVEEGCPRPSLSCYYLATHLDACHTLFSDLWRSPPPGFEHAFSLPVGAQCAASCALCTDEQHRATVSRVGPDRWPGRLLPVTRIPGSATQEVERHVGDAFSRGPLIVADAMGEAFRAHAWSRAAIRARCAAPAGAPPPAPPWPTIAFRQPSSIGAKWAGLRFENGAALGVRDLPGLIDAQDGGRLAGVMLFDSPCNHTCPAMLRRAADDAAPDRLAAPRFFPRDFEVALGGAKGEGLWRKGGRPWDDPDVFVSKAGTTTHVHIDGHCTRFWMLQLSGRKLWRVLPPSEIGHLAGVPNEKGTDTHFLADVIFPEAERNRDVNASLDAVEKMYEFILSPGELALIPENYAHAVHNLDDTAAMTYNFVDQANLPCYLASLRPHAGRLLRKFFSQLAQGRGRSDAASAFARHPPLAYYAHLSVRAKTERTVSVLENHIPWADFFSQQGPYANGGETALEAEVARLATALLTLIEASPPPVEAAEEELEALLSRFDLINAPPIAAHGEQAHDEL